MGMKVAAVSLMCQDVRVFQAMEMAGTPCPYEGSYRTRGSSYNGKKTLMKDQTLKNTTRK